MIDMFSLFCGGGGGGDSKEAGEAKTTKKQEDPFHLPMHYLDADKRHPITTIVSSDLELLAREQGQKEVSAYEAICEPSHVMGSHTLTLWNREFTSDTAFLKETQSIIRDYNSSTPSSDIEPDLIRRVRDQWKDVKEDDFFMEKYGFMEWDILKFVNYSDTYLECVTIAQILSPILTLLLPFFILIIPFFVLQVKGIKISFETYIDTLKTIARNHFFGKILDAATSAVSLQNIGYLFLTTGMYIYSLYSNVILCQHFYKNVERMNNQLIDLRLYLQNTIEKMNQFYSAHSGKPCHRPFCDVVRGHSDRLRLFASKLDNVTPFSITMGKLASIGSMLKTLYEIRDDASLHQSVQYSLGFQGYMDNLRGVSRRLGAGDVALADFFDGGEDQTDGEDGEEGKTDEEGKEQVKEDAMKKPKHYTYFKDQVYPLIKGVVKTVKVVKTGEEEEKEEEQEVKTSAVKNDLSMEKNIILTGPNASGKTTVLKTTLINIIFSQQWGCGFYKSARFRPYTHIHSYLNIPDSSGRDSLFQAESRRCKEILDCVHETSAKASHHFCIFDELYSGTNYKEATRAALSFLRYLSRFPHVDFILTTHYRKICKNKASRIANYKMHVIEDGDNIKYTFKMKPGVSKVEGGVRILKEMNYPDEMIRAMREEA
jgi:hypothetical protein